MGVGSGLGARSHLSEHLHKVVRNPNPNLDPNPNPKVIHNLDEYGNTSAGSIPLALDEAVRSGAIKTQP